MATAVLVGSFIEAPADIDALAIGTVTVVDENGLNPSAASNQINIIKVVSKRNLVLPDGTAKEVAVTFNTGLIEKDEVRGKAKMSPFKAAVEQKTEVDFSAGVFSADSMRVAIKIIMDDVEGFKSKYTKTFDVVGAGLTAAVVATTLASKINKSFGDIVIATAAAGKLTLVGQPVREYAGTRDFSGYYQNGFDVAVYTNVGEAVMSATPIDGVTVKLITAADKGIGTFPIVRDRERDNLGYAGNNNRYVFPVGEPRITADASKTYDSITFTYQRSFLTPDNQYVKNQPKSVELYVTAGTGTALESAITAFLA